MPPLLSPERATAVMDAQSALLGMPVAPEYRAGVVNYLCIAASLAEPMLKLASTLTPADESGSVFRPVAPVGAVTQERAAAESSVEMVNAPAAATVAGTAIQAVESAFARIQATDAQVNAFTALVPQRARARAAQLDVSTAPLPLHGVPFAVKNLFDIQGLTTLAGSRIERDAPPATRDAAVIRRLEAAGAVLVGALNMDEYAYGFTTENTHYGACRNPQDPSRISGGSSGGSAAAVAAGQVPFTLGSDTNGSIRVPASLCGVFGLKPTYGRLPRAGSFPFVGSLDHVGPFANSVELLARVYDAMQGPDEEDPAQAPRCIEPTAPLLGRGEKAAQGLRIGVLGGWFHDMATEPARRAVARVAQALGLDLTAPAVHWPEVPAARAAAFIITNAEGSALHLKDLQTRASEFDPHTRDRFIAGALLPAAWVQQSQRVRHWFARQVAQSFAQWDVLLAPATPCVAQPIGTDFIEIAGQRMNARASMGLLTQPISCIGLPVVTVPVWGVDPAHPHLSIGVQVVAAPWREDLALRVAHALERQGVVAAHANGAGLSA
ncbi:MAG: AtzE family amidohydrolase [Betaproteobacteria bacterium]|nr:AtzE family amidohydrolase [Betaproteobacteria bacterium]